MPPGCVLRASQKISYHGTFSFLARTHGTENFSRFLLVLERTIFAHYAVIYHIKFALLSFNNSDSWVHLFTQLSFHFQLWVCWHDLAITIRFHNFFECNLVEVTLHVDVVVVNQHFIMFLLTLNVFGKLEAWVTLCAQYIRQCYILLLFLYPQIMDILIWALDLSNTALLLQVLILKWGHHWSIWGVMQFTNPFHRWEISSRHFRTLFGC